MLPEEERKLIKNTSKKAGELWSSMSKEEKSL
jgi:hypothetical protein